MPEEYILTFANTHSTILVDSIMRDGGVPVTVTPVPPAITAGCGICLRIPVEAFVEAEQLLGTAPQIEGEWHYLSAGQYHKGLPVQHPPEEKVAAEPTPVTEAVPPKKEAEARPVKPSLSWDREVIVGVLHNTRQFKVNYEHKFYHMPAKLFTGRLENVRYVALYRSKKSFGKGDAGVPVYGRISACSLVNRGDIKELPTRNAGEKYYRFDVEEWISLEPPIKAGGIGPGVSMFTTLYLIQHSRYVPELYIQDPHQFAVYVLLRKAASRSRRIGTPEILPSVEGYTCMISEYDIGVYTPDGRYEQHNLRDFFKEPYSFLAQMSKILDIG